jgi:hypothetical protein
MQKEIDVNHIGVILQEEKRKRKMLRFCKERQSRVSWTPDMKFNECNHSLFRFYPAKYMIIYGRCYNFSCLG